MLAIRNVFTVTLALSMCAMAWAAEEEPESPIKVDKENRRVSIPAKVLKQGIHEELKGAIEYVACCPGGKEYESLFSCPVDPKTLYDALLELGLKPGKPAQEGETEDDYALPEGERLTISVEWKQDGKQMKEPVESFILDKVTEKPMQALGWAFTGSSKQKDPDTGEEVLGVTATKNLVSLHHRDATVLLQNPSKDARDDSRYKTNLEALPKEGTEVVLILEVPKTEEEKKKEAEKYTGKIPRIHWIISGKVRKVGFRQYVERAALQNRVRGWVRNLPDGTVEIMAEGTTSSLKKFVRDASRGPRGAQVRNIKKLDPPAGDLGRFEIQTTPTSMP